MPRVISSRHLAEPHAFRSERRYFAIRTSSHHANAAGVAYRDADGAAFGIYETDAFGTEPWTYRGGLLAPLDEPQHWAPEVVLTPDGEVYRDERNEIWCFFSAGTDQEHWIYLATSRAPPEHFLTSVDPSSRSAQRDRAGSRARAGADDARSRRRASPPDPST